MRPRGWRGWTLWSRQKAQSLWAEMQGASLLLIQKSRTAGCPSWALSDCFWPDAHTIPTKLLRSHGGSRLGTRQGSGPSLVLKGSGAQPHPRALSHLERGTGLPSSPPPT